MPRLLEIASGNLVPMFTEERNKAQKVLPLLVANALAGRVSQRVVLEKAAIAGQNVVDLALKARARKAAAAAQAEAAQTAANDAYRKAAFAAQSPLLSLDEAARANKLAAQLLPQADKATVQAVRDDLIRAAALL